MGSFYVEKVYAYGNGKKTSVVEFKNGLNIVCGPSNTGKSYIIAIIDYLFGGKSMPIDPLLGYDTVAMDIVTDKGEKAHLKRKLGTNKIEMDSDISGIESKEYSTKKINEMYLKLIGIDSPIKIISSKDFATQTLSWRTILKMFLINDERISQHDSILESAKFKNITAALSSFLYLIDGVDRTPDEEKEDKKIREAKKKAVTEYIKKQIVSFTEKNNELNDEYAKIEKEDIEQEIEIIVNEIAETENKINSATEKSKIILKNIYELSAKLEETEFLQERYASLKTQYEADIKRLDFIIDGEKKAPKPNLSKCPFCDAEMNKHSHTSYVKSSETEMKKIKILLAELKEMQEELTKETEEYKKEMEKLNLDNDEIQQLIEKELKPHTEELKSALSKNRQKLEIKNEMSFIKKIAVKFESDIYENENEEESTLTYNVKNHFERETIDGIDKNLDEMLTKCGFPEYLTSHINLDEFDVVINARSKRVEGKGYRAFINTVFAYSIMKYLANNAKYAPKMLILDSPIRSLSEKDESIPERANFSTDGMKSALFRYFADNQETGQIIIAENTIPNVNYKDAKIIRFTQDKNIGRYGFLEQPN